MSKFYLYSKIGWMLLTCFILLGFLLNKQPALMMGIITFMSWTALRILEDGVAALIVLTSHKRDDKIQK